MTNYLARMGEQPAQARLVECLVVDRMMVSKVLRLPKVKGLVVRAVHPEETRAYRVVLTEAGRKALGQAFAVAQAE